jgi:KUP system potassium uptake protein
MRRSFHEGAHKLRAEGYPGRLTKPLPDRPARELEAHRDPVGHAGRVMLALGALGVVYGDIGTSPLYTEQVIFTAHGNTVRTTPAGVYGVSSLVFLALIIIVSLKYAGVIMRAHNRGDGGIMALTALVQRRDVARKALLITLGIFGASLFLGDGMITPAISVMSAVEGLNVATPGLTHLVIPISLAILVSLFVLQRFGTGTVGVVFGPVMLLWFAVIAVLGGREVLEHPAVLQGLSPTYGVRFFLDHGFAAFLVLGSVVLAVTGAEALYADRGHFGPWPIRLSWFAIVLPGVMLSYLGQGALILAHPESVRNPFFLLVPSGWRIAMVLLATGATIIASQAVISGSFSMARQAVQLGFLPMLNVRHTSKVEGQIYVPAINWGLCLGVVLLVVAFGSSSKLANIYGVAVTGTFVLDTVLFLAVARSWGMARWKLVSLGALFLVVEIAFFASNLAKIAHGAWLPLLVGLALSGVMINWRKGREIVTRNRAAQEGSLEDFLAELPSREPPVLRAPGVAVHLSPDSQVTPLALRAQVDHVNALHEKVVIVSVEHVGLPYVGDEDRFAACTPGSGQWKVRHITARFGYQERSTVPAALALARKQGLLERNLDLEHASYFVSRITILPTRAPGMAQWRKKLFVAMARNAASPMSRFGLPGKRTVQLGSEVDL